MAIFASIQTVSDLENLTARIHNGSVEIALDDLVLEFSTTNLVNNIRTLVMRETGLTEFPRLLSNLDRALSSQVQGLPHNPTDTQLGNLAFFMPTHIKNAWPYYRQFLSNLSSYASTVPLYNDSYVLFLVHSLKRDPQLALSPALALQLAFRISTISVLDEASILDVLRDRINPVPGHNIVRTMLSRRLAQLSDDSATSSLPESPKVALIVAGQMRDTENSLRRIARYFKLEDYDVYVSTWQRPGFTPLDKVRLTRRLDAEALAYVEASVAEHELAQMRVLELESIAETADDLSSLIASHLGSSRNLEINVSDEEYPPFKGQSNSWKMHFHNRYWPSRLGHSYFLENYDLTVKIRPDILFTGFDNLSAAEIPDPGRDILNDHPSWLYETWGFGMGDQFFMGRTETMLSILDIEFPSSLSTQMQTTVLGRNDYLQGHVSVGTELWLRGGSPRSMGIKKLGLASDSKLTLSEVTALHNQIKGKLS